MTIEQQLTKEMKRTYTEPPGDSKLLQLLKEALEEAQRTRSVQHDERARYQSVEITELEKLIAYHLIYVEE